jgi:hypothetical protein
MAKTSAKKVTRTWAEVDHNGWDYKVYPNGAVVTWRLSYDGHGYWDDLSSFDTEYDIVKSAGLNVLDERVCHE